MKLVPFTEVRLAYVVETQRLSRCQAWIVGTLDINNSTVVIKILRSLVCCKHKSVVLFRGLSLQHSRFFCPPRVKYDAMHVTYKRWFYWNFFWCECDDRPTARVWQEKLTKRLSCTALVTGWCNQSLARGLSISSYISVTQLSPCISYICFWSFVSGSSSPLETFIEGN